PMEAVVDSLKREKTKPAAMPKDSLGILDLASGGVFKVERVKSFALPEEGAGWVAYLLEKDTARAAEPKPDSAAAERKAGPGGSGEETKRGREKENGTTLVLRNLATGEEHRFEHVVDYRFTKDGARLAYAASSKDGDADGVFVVDVARGVAAPALMGKGEYKGLVWDDAGERLAFLSDRDDYEAEQPSFALYLWRPGDDEATAIAREGDRGIPAGWWVSEHGELSFSKSGRRLFFGTAPRPAPEPDEAELPPEDERVVVDIWNWKDPYLQPMQLVRAEREKQRTYAAVYHIGDRRIVQLATETVPEVDVVTDADFRHFIGSSELPYRQLVSWDGTYADIYLVDVETGESERIMSKHRGAIRLSPKGTYAAWYDMQALAWFALDVEHGDVVNLTESVPHPVYDELDDHPQPPPPYGAAGWTTDEKWFLVYDRHDIWATDPTGRQPARNITDGVGREQNLRFRYVRLDRDEEAIDASRPLLLSAFDLRTKADGFYRDRVDGNRRPERLIMEDRAFGNPVAAEDADVLMLTRSSFQEFPDLWVTDPSFREMRRISDANPQQARYRWGTAELVEWHSVDGTPLQGILYKPEDFDPSKKYPMMVYFYERMSDGLHQYRTPVPGGSSISFSFYVSRGYLVFVPDIPYQIGYPGESALHAVVPGVLELVRRGFVDEDAIGVQGHSWGGYQIAYMITKTNLFAAAEAGAPVANMTSAYGGIRWSSGMSRMFQYEKTQSRIGGTLWNAHQRFIENSPIFWADKVETPLLMMHNDKDGAVPWYQGIEYFVALRRLGKPVWMLNYNGEDHGLRKWHNRKDWAIRMQQFFDHFLKGAPAPVWLEHGVPAVEKGRTLGLELVTEVATDGGGVVRR
ncbi:MAG TPA: prolyl oligopeptidase family serine peptidase, partial [Longimicrobiales bacterium]